MTKDPPDDASMGPPKFTKELKDLTIDDGAKLELTVKVEGDPEPQVNWTKNGNVRLQYFIKNVSKLL